MAKQPKNTKTFCYENANPAGLVTGDCIMRAVVCASGKSWEWCVTRLCELALAKKLAPQDPKTEVLLYAQMGFVKMKQPRHSNNTKYTGAEFCRFLNASWRDVALAAGLSGERAPRIIAHLGGHHSAAIVMDDSGFYRVHDIWPSDAKSVGNYWVGDYCGRD